MTLREIDALVAEKVMGVKPRLSWECLNEDETATMISFDTKHEADEWLADKRRRGYPVADRHIGTWKHWPHYTTDPAAAKQVREKLGEQGWMIQDLHHGPCGFTFDCSKDDASSFVSSDPWVNDGESDEVDWPSEELAVCVCALKTVGVTINAADVE